MILNCPNCGSEVSENARFCTNCGATLTHAAKEKEEAAAAYCRNCGARLPEGADYCPDCGTSVVASPTAPGARLRPELAGWGERFIAWLIDMIILGIVVGPWIQLPGYLWGPEFLRGIPFVDFGTRNVIYFIYWMFMEGVYGQSIGKMILKIKVTRLNGEPADLVHAAIESLGKAFLLPIDCIVGWILYPAKKQRLFNYASETIVVRASR